MQRSGRWVKHRRQKCHDKKKLWLVVAVVVVYVAAKSAELFQFFGRSERFVFQVENDLRTAKGSQNDLEKKQMQSLRPNRQWRSEAPVGYTLSFCWREPLWPLWRQRKANNTRKSTPRGHFSTHQEPCQPRIGHAERHKRWVKSVYLGNLQYFSIS